MSRNKCSSNWICCFFFNIVCMCAELNERCDLAITIIIIIGNIICIENLRLNTINYTQRTKVINFYHLHVDFRALSRESFNKQCVRDMGIFEWASPH